MTFPGLRYCRPATVPEATELLASEPASVPLAGGQSLLALLALRRVKPGLLIDLAGLESELGGIRASAGTLQIGALARQQDLLTEPAVREQAPLLAAAARLVANPQVRARGTVGGALAHRDPPAEIPAALAALGATVDVTGPGGERTVALGGVGTVLELDPGELISHVTVPAGPPVAGWDFDELAGRFAARPLVAVAAVAGAEGARTRLAVAGLTAGPAVLEFNADEVDAGVSFDAIHARLRELPPVPDSRASVAYRQRLAATLGARSLRRADAGAPRGPEVPKGRSARVGVPRPLPPAASAAIVVEVNGQRRELSVAAGRTLAQILREDLALTATHLGCEHGVCGSCNVLVDGTAVRACLMLAAQADGRSVDTVEGLRDRGALQRLLPAFVEHQALQCGFCTPGMLVTLAGLGEAPADRRALREQLVGNLCRCTGYRPILDAAQASL